MRHAQVILPMAGLAKGGAPAPSRRMLPPAQRAAVGFAPYHLVVMLLPADRLAAVVASLVLFHTILAYQSVCAGGWALIARSLAVYNPTTQKEVA